MSEFNEDDIALQHERLADRSGYLRLTHRPSGVFVDAHLDSRPVLRVKQELTNELRRKVLMHDGDQGHDQPPASPTALEPSHSAGRSGS